MLLAQALIIAFVAALLTRRLPFARPVAAVESVAPEAEKDGTRKKEPAPIAGTGSPWRFHVERSQLPVIIGVVAGLLALIPANDGASLAMALRGLWGDPSVTSVQLLFLVLAGRTPTAFTTGWRAPAVIAIIAALFYPLALGATDFDPYRLGYAPVLLLLPLAITAAVLWHRGQSIWLWLLAIDLLVWALGLPESPNLWDTLLDPLLAFFCIALTVRNGWRSFRKAP